MKRKNAPYPKGNIEISSNRYYGNRHKVTIAGDPEGLRSLAKMLLWLADVDQEQTTIPDGEREHIHLHAGFQLSNSSKETELCRLDAKGTGDFPKDFIAKSDRQT